MKKARRGKIGCRETPSLAFATDSFRRLFLKPSPGSLGQLEVAAGLQIPITHKAPLTLEPGTLRPVP